MEEAPGVSEKALDAVVPLAPNESARAPPFLLTPKLEDKPEPRLQLLAVARFHG